MYVVRNQVVEALLAVWVIYLMFGARFKPTTKPDKLSKSEIDMLVDEWEPIPLSPPLTEREANLRQVPVVDGVEEGGALVTVDGKADVLNLGSGNYLGLAGDRECLEAALETLREYGCGSCGPRGFYGSVAPHITLEEEFASWLGVEETILYSFGFATIASAIPAFAKRGDVIVADRAVSFAVQTGLRLSRSKILWYNHNDMDDLERVLAEYVSSATTRGGKLNRRFIVTEGLFANTGVIADLPAIVALKNKYRFRLIVEESHSLGVLGETGKGITEHHNVSIDELLFLTASLGNAFASIGGICAGPSIAIDHQRLSGSGYCFSASAPPMLSSAATAALAKLASDPRGILDQLSSRIAALHASPLSSIQGIIVRGEKDSPFVHLVLDAPESALVNETALYAQETFWDTVADAVLDSADLLVAPTKYNRSEEYFHPAPSLLVSVSAATPLDTLDTALSALASTIADHIDSLPAAVTLNEPIPDLSPKKSRRQSPRLRRTKK